MQVSILRECGNEFCHVCGGTIISPAWILTSAHCVSSVPIEEMGILLGDHNLYELSYEQKFVRAAEKVTHPGRYCMQQIGAYPKVYTYLGKLLGIFDKAKKLKK